MNAVTRIVEILSTAAPSYRDEYDLQSALAGALEQAGIRLEREHRLSDGESRVDLWVPKQGIAIEVKIKGAAAQVIRQVSRYARCREVNTVVLVTTKASHHRMPHELHGKPVLLVSLIGAGL